LALTPGTRLGVYDITAQIGAGGMGEVYRATDTNLKRQVALKVLPASVAADADRLARFQREAEVLASLNHAHIGAIYGLEKSAGLTALVMELVEGEDLADRIARGPIPFDEALPIAKQIAEALEAAHEQGIIHRDLKPANIKVRPDGTVKVLDFGLAKAMDPVGSPTSMSQSPTITTPAMTEVGMILGTASYMSPEQARGRTVDKRTDIWAFGAVLFEMLTGRRAFEGELTSDVLASVLKTEPNWQIVPPETPIELRRLLRRCLDKNPRSRLQAIGEARAQIESFLGGASEESAIAQEISLPPLPEPSRRMVAIVSATLLTVATALTTWALTRAAPEQLQAVRFTIVPPTAQQFATVPTTRDLAISPDGTRLVYMGLGGLMVRAIDQLDAVPLRDIANVRNPFFSPDGRSIGFFTQNADGEIKTVSMAGGSPLSLSRYSGAPRGASWGPDDSIVFATTDPSSGLLRVSANGGQPSVLTTPDTAHGEGDHLFPSVLPGGQAVLFTIAATSGSIQNAQVALLDMKNGQRKVLIRGGSQAQYVKSGHLVYVVSGALTVVRFDLARLEVVGDPVQIIDRMLIGQLGAANFAVSQQGTLVYLPTSAGPQNELRSLLWVTRQGREAPIALPRRPYAVARLSPDGMRMALDVREQNSDILIWDFGRQTTIRLTNDAAADMSPVWTPNGRRLIWSSARDNDIGNLYWQASDGTGSAERLTTNTFAQFPTSISPDGTRVLLFAASAPQSRRAISILTLPAPSAGLEAGRLQPEPLLQSSADQQNGEISPDGCWIAYQSNESGRPEIYVRPFPKVDAERFLISPSGGTRPAWARNGRELFYLDGDGRLTSVPVQSTATTFRPGAPAKILDTRYYAGFSRRGQELRAYDVSPDGQRFLMIKDEAGIGETVTSASMVVVVNWHTELKALVPVKK
jgi:serine/threonine-protein kinase